MFYLREGCPIWFVYLVFILAADGLTGAEVILYLPVAAATAALPIYLFMESEMVSGIKDCVYNVCEVKCVRGIRLFISCYLIPTVKYFVYKFLKYVAF